MKAITEIQNNLNVCAMQLEDINDFNNGISYKKEMLNKLNQELSIIETRIIALENTKIEES